MKNLLTTLLFILFHAALFAQPTLTSNIMLDVGDSGPVQPFNMATFDAGPSGANATWDFSNVTPAGMEFNWTAEDPAQTPYGNEFPTATLAFDFPLDTVRDIRYYNYDGSKLNLLGYVTTLGGSSSDTFRYDFNANPTLEIPLPLAYEDQVTNASSGTATIGINGMTFEVDRTIDRTITADAYGTLMTPLGTFQNVMRVRISENITDKIFGQTNATQENARYFWYLPNEKYLLLQMDSIVIKNAGGDFPSTSMFYRSGDVMTSLDKNLAQEIGMKAYPNPTSGEVHLSFQTESTTSISIEILSPSGQVVWKEKNPILASGLYEKRIDTSSLSAGVYFVRAKTEKGSGVHMLVINH